MLKYKKMKIGFIIPSAVIAYSGGVPVQGRMWKEGLENNGDEVHLISTWGQYDWNSYDFIIFLGIGKLLIDYTELLISYPKPKLIIAPIIDFPRSLKEYRFRAKFFGSVKFKVNRALHDFYYCRNRFDYYLARSEHEKKYIEKGIGVEPSKVLVIPLSIRLKNNIKKIDLLEKENFCLHVSRLACKGKNVARLVEAAKKYNFQLKLAGSIFGENERKWLENLINNVPNVEYLGYLSEDELKNYYMRAKVFALPSIAEGVGFVALEAAAYGDEIILTDIGAPKEYYRGRASLVSPYDVDSIGKAICAAIANGKSQPQLSNYIINNYSFDVLSKLLHDTLNSILD